MTRLIVDDGGKRRAFKVHDGVLTVGSGEDATLRLEAAGVADLHLDLVVEGGRARLRPRPGVVPPLVAGVPATAELEVPHARPIRVGEATLTIEYDHVPPPRKPSARIAPATGRRAPVAAPGGPASTRSRRPRSSGLPGWLFAVMILGVAGAAVFLASKVLTSAPPADIGARATLARVRQELATGSLEQARLRLEGLAREQLPADVRQEYEAVRAEYEAAAAESELALHNLAGNSYLQTQLKNFEQQRLRGEVERPEVRVFLKRCREFRERWPRHPELAWVDRMERRFADLVDLDEPPTLEDLEFEVETMTWAEPRDFGGAIALLQEFVDKAQGQTAQAGGRVLIEDLEKRRREWFADRLQQARFEFDRGETGKSVGWLVTLIVYSGDQAMADQAAEELVKFEGLAGWLQAYREQQPDKYARLRLNDVVAAYIRRHDLEPDR